MEYSLYDADGRRKYLVPVERTRFLQACLDVKGPTGSFCVILALTGARITEVLQLTPERIDEANSAINFRTLKQNKKQKNPIRPTRAVPVPREVLMFLDGILHYREAQADPKRAKERLWDWSRTTGWRRVKKVMRIASAPSYVAMPKALRHAFGVEATMESVALTMVQRWLGHKQIKTTTIYTTVVGPEERQLAERMWRGFLEGIGR
ncbi:MAG: tyrosine-type recombinase/integrase [Alphaproteobacteria bacterium]|nr:tyrosine-type recombinase/integrase [Alphaproteobacteria bacterium]